MFASSSRFFVLALVIGLSGVSCGTDADSNHDEDQHDDMELEADDCGGAENLDMAMLGLKKDGAEGHFSVALEAADPLPTEKGENTWTLEITDGEGATVDDATVVVTPFMPDHGHGVSPPDYAGASGGSGGLYEVPTFNLIMPGVWELTVAVSRETIADEAVFRLCVGG